jgi:hypothetical protein
VALISDTVGQLLQAGRVAQLAQHLVGPVGQVDAVERAAHVGADGGQVFGRCRPIRR